MFKITNRRYTGAKTKLLENIYGVLKTSQDLLPKIYLVLQSLNDWGSK
ncbi:hypothetical protein [Helicobacter sp. 13S00477-4]|nr:hypothetical protein [Helicobacter sp. 13S00477-4]